MLETAVLNDLARKGLVRQQSGQVRPKYYKDLGEDRMLTLGGWCFDKRVA